MGTVILIIVVGLGCMILGFCGGRYEPLESVIRAEIEARLTAELDAAYDEGFDDGRADRTVGGADRGSLEAAEVPGVRRADLDRPHLGESPGPVVEVHHGSPGRQPDHGEPGPGPANDDLGADAPGLRDPRELADTPGPQDAPWEPAAGDLIVRQAGHHYDASPGTAPGAGLSQSAATAAGPGEDYQLPDVLPARPADLFDLLDDGAAFSMIRDEFTALRIETVAWRPVLPAWTESGGRCAGGLCNV